MFGLDEQTSLLTWFAVSVTYAVDLIIRLWLLFHIPKRRRPTAAMAWLLLIFIIPVLGTIFFFIIGTPKLSRRRRAIQDRVNKALKKQAKYLQDSRLTASVDGRFKSVANLSTELTSLKPTDGNRIEVLYGYDNIIQQMIKSVNKARDSVLIQFYIIALDETTEPFFEALESAIKRGVSVYVLFDAWGSHKYPRFREMKERLSDIGAEWRPMLPISLHPARYNRPDLRNHRKIFVIDSYETYIGSLNMIAKHYHRKDDITYTELVTRIEGPAAAQASAVFASDWYAETGKSPGYELNYALASQAGDSVVQVVPSGSNYSYRNNLLAFVEMIHKAKHSVLINNPYLVPDESLLGALISAAKRGVKVSIINSERIDQWVVGHAQRSYYQELLEAGISISLYKKPHLVHDKFISIDDEIGVVGSSNLDIRSFELNLECVVILYDTKAATTLRRRHEDLVKESRTLTLKAWQERPVVLSVAESLARLSSSLQ